MNVFQYKGSSEASNVFHGYGSVDAVNKTEKLLLNTKTVTQSRGDSLVFKAPNLGDRQLTSHVDFSQYNKNILKT